MSKKHFIELADRIKANRDAFSDFVINELAYFCEDQNPRFDRDRWLGYIAGTCGPSGGKVKVTR